MATFTVRAEGIIRQPALTMPGNATGSEAACTSLSASQIRTLLGLSTTSDVTFDIVRATTSVQTPLVNNASAALTLGNATYGVTVPGAATFSGDISMSKTSAQGYVYAYATNGTAYTRMFNSGTSGYVTSTQALSLSCANGYAVTLDSPSGAVYAYSSGVQTTFRVLSSSGSANTGLTHDGTNGILSTSSGYLDLRPANGIAYVWRPGSTASFQSFESSGNYYTSMSHNSTNGVLSTNYGNLNLVPAGGTTSVTGAFAVSGGATIQMSSTAGSINVVTNYIELSPTSGNAYVFKSGTNATFDVYNSNGTKWVRTSHNGTDGAITASSGNLNLVPAGGTVAVTGGITASSYATISRTSSTYAANGSVYGHLRMTTPNTLGQHSGISMTDSGFVSEKYFGAVMVSTVSSDFVWQGLNRVSGVVWQEYMRLTENGVLTINQPGSGSANVGLKHDGTNGILSTSSGALVLNPATSIIGIGGITSSFPAIKRSSTTAAFRLGDDSADAPITCAGITASGNVSITKATNAVLSLASGTRTGYIDVYGGDYIYFRGTGSQCWFGAQDANDAVIFTSATARVRVASTGEATFSKAVILNSGLQTAFVTKSANYTTTVDDHTVCVTANTIDITLETAVGCAGRVHVIQNSGSGVVTLKTTSSQTISGNASGALTLNQWDSKTVQSDGANWIII